MHTVYDHGRRASCIYLVALYWLHEQCLKIYCWERGWAPSDTKQTKLALSSHQFTKYRRFSTTHHRIILYIKWCMKNRSCTSTPDIRVLHARYEHPVTNNGVALASFQSDTQFTTRMRQNTIHGRLGKTSNKSVYEAYINEEQRHDKCTDALHYKRSQKRKRRGGGVLLKTSPTLASFYLNCEWLVTKTLRFSCVFLLTRIISGTFRTR